MKRILAIVLILLMVCGLCACGKEAPKGDSADKDGTTTATTGDATTTTTTEGDGEDTTTGTAGDTTTSATEGEGSTTAGTSGTAGTTTKKPTTTTAKGEEGASIRILAIGDDTAKAPMDKYLYDLLKGAGYTSIKLGVLYADKSSLDTTYDNVKGDKAVYQYRENTAGKWTSTDKCAPSKVLKADSWDYVILQQSLADAGLAETYSKRSGLTDLLKQKCGDAQLYWQMTWAYRRNGGAAGLLNYKNNESYMYQEIVTTALQQVMRDNNITGLIPAGTTVQNLRTSVIRDELTTHATGRLTDYGAYATALTWYAILTGESAADVSYRPDAVKKYFAELAEAADNAVSVPNEVTPTATGDGEYKDLRILSIGHSFSLDAMRTYMWDLFDAAGYNVTIGYLYYPSCNLEQHWHYISDNSKSYEQYGKNKNGKWEVLSNVDALTALYDEDWDIITFQPDPDYGWGNVSYACQWGCGKNISSDYVHFDELVDLVLQKLASNDNPHGPNTDVQLYYHLTWTWREGCYLYPSGYNQQKLYQSFLTATKNNILTNDKILGVIPCNTSIENARTSWMGDTFNAEAANDGYHLNDKGDLVAALTWVCYFTGVKASDIYFDASYSDTEIAAIKEAVDNAIKTPESITQSSYKTGDEPINNSPFNDGELTW